jgi:uncharacterized integral membrane protein (TIGR00698 family)
VGAVKKGWSEDWLAVVLGLLLLGVALGAVWTARATAGQTDEKASVENPLKPYLATPAKWKESPLEAVAQPAVGLVGAMVVCLAVFALGVRLGGGPVEPFLKAFPLLFLLAVLAYLLSEQAVIKYYGLEYALWALFTGLLISNTVGTPALLRPAVRTELYIKVGLVLLGAEVLFGKLLALGIPGICIAWITTPIVLITTYWFGQRVLKMESRSLNMVISADMSVCGVSAAIATASACKAKKEELSLAIGISLAFTVIMMVVQPMVIRAIGLDPVIGGAWIGGTIDSTGAVAAAGAALGKEAELVATTVKMIQNILIGVVAFFVAVYWVTAVERTPDSRPDAREIWRRFPKFIFGFLAASVVMSVVNDAVAGGPEIVKATIDGATKTLRGWFFCLAFVSIGLETNFRELGRFLRGGKPLTLYVCGQALNLALTLLMSWLMFKVVFPGAADVLGK